MTINDLDYTSPVLLGAGQPYAHREAEVLGSAVWLWMQSKSHWGYKLHTLAHLLLPAIKSGQYVLASQNNQPVFYLAWANLNKDAETRYLNRANSGLQALDWTSGDRAWLIDWIAPFGHTTKVQYTIRHRLWRGLIARSLYHRGAEKGIRVMGHFGSDVTPQAAKAYFEQHPLAPNDHQVKQTFLASHTFHPSTQIPEKL